jgi:hypothetical protein
MTRQALIACILVSGLACARPTPSSAVASRASAAAPPAIAESWKTCSVARALARQFSRGLALLAEVEPYLAEDGLSFRVCDRERLDCNGAAQPFPGECRDRFYSQRLSKSIATSWSSGARPLERSASYAVVFMESRTNDIVAELALGYQFVGNPGADTRGPHVWAGVAETSEDLPTIRVVIPKDHPSTTRESTIVLGEREIDSAAETQPVERRPD